MRLGSVARGRYLAEVVAAGARAIVLCCCPARYRAWAGEVGGELAHLRVVGCLTALLRVVRLLEEGTWCGGDRLVDAADGLRTLLERLLGWTHPSETLDHDVAVAAQACASILELAPTPRDTPRCLPVPEPTEVSGGASVRYPEASPEARPEVDLWLERLRSAHQAEAVLLLDPQGRLLAASRVADAESSHALQVEPLSLDGIGQVSPQVLAGMPPLLWTCRIRTEQRVEVLAQSVGKQAVLVAVGGGNGLWRQVNQPETRSALELVLERLEQVGAAGAEPSRRDTSRPGKPV